MKVLILLCISSVALASSQCGLRLSKALNKTSKRYERAIIGGTNVTSPDKWPWQILLISSISGTEEDIKVCGGTIVGEQWVLTAAHCVENFNDSSRQLVLAGASYISEFEKELASNVTEVFIHPSRDNEYKTNDIALLKLDAPLVFSNVIAPICLPSPTQSIPNDGRAVVTGFGRLNVDGTNETMSDGRLREAIVPIIDPEVCEERWSHAAPGYEELSIMIWRQRRVVCASSIDHGTHLGDSGGPLMMTASDGRWFQIGITAFIRCESDDCDAPGDGIRGDLFPKAFTDVRKYCDWIKETTGGEVSCQEEVTLEDVEIEA